MAAEHRMTEIESRLAELESRIKALEKRPVPLPQCTDVFPGGLTVAAYESTLRPSPEHDRKTWPF